MSNNGSSSAVIYRRDYLPFGEEVSAGIGLRSTSQAYGPGDTNRWSYGLTERDNRTGLDHTWFRKYESRSGRWTSPDPLSGTIADPQSLNHYTYTQNDPVNFVDPSGLDIWDANPGFIPASQNGWSRTVNPTQTFINYVQDKTAAWHDFWGDGREFPWFFGGWPGFSFGEGVDQKPKNNSTPLKPAPKPPASASRPAVARTRPSGLRSSRAKPRQNRFS